MRRVLSSRQTPLIKFVIPVIWIGCFAGVTLGLFLFPHAFRDESGQPPHASMKYWFLILTVVGWYFIYRSCIRLERVAIDDTSLYVSNYRTEIVVPLRDVERVTENRWENIHPVTIHMRSDTEFGSRIVFMPHRRWFAWWTSHPVVAELREAVERAGGMSGAARQPEPRPIG